MKSYFARVTSFIGLFFGAFIYFPIVRSVDISGDWAWFFPMLLFPTLVLFLLLYVVTLLFGKLEPYEVNDT